MTKIEWTQATWNPVVGCSVVSPGCTNCYAMRMAHRLANNDATPHYAGTVRTSRAGPVWTGKLAMAPDHVLTAPLRCGKPTLYFVNSMGDLFHEDVPDDWIDRVFAVMMLTTRHRFQVLTKRADRMQAYLTEPGGAHRLAAVGVQAQASWWGKAIEPRSWTVYPPASEAIGRYWPHPNIWIGVSAEDQARADARIPDLLATPGSFLRFVSAEPLLGPLDLRAAMATSYRHPQGISTGLHWVIVGGESGPGARPMHPDWARSLRDQCQAAGVPFFFKQWGAWRHTEAVDGDATTLTGYRVGKRAAGRLLDGREWNDMPEARP